MITETFNTDLDRIHVDKTWFYLMRNRQKVRVFLEEDKMGSPK